MNEAETRKEIIDLELNKRGWHIANPTEVIVEFEMEKRLDSKPGVAYSGSVYNPKHEYADYLLLGRDGQTPLAVVEAKKTSKNPRVGQRQAEGYADNIAKKYRVEPFIFLTNGEATLFWDRLRYPPRKVYGFFERPDMERLNYLRATCEDRPSKTPVNQTIANREYQLEAIKRIGERLEKKHRKCLLVMATGSGKTRTAMALIDVLLRAKWVSNVLFLADRKLLRDQAYGKKGFQGFFTEAMDKIKSSSFDKTKRLYAATIQTMEEVYKDISPGFFDLVIMDECHRSIYNKWQDILAYFDAIQIGLTATPSESIDRDTLRFFECEEGRPTFNYSYDEAIEDKILVPFTPYHAKTSFQIKGLKSGEIPQEIKDKLIAEGKTEEELNFEGTDLEKKFTNKASLESMVKEFMEVCIKDETGVLPGKSIYFAISKEHAYRILDTYDRLYPQYKGKLAEVIVSDDSRSDTFLQRFENESFPRIAISVDMLDTGVDIREAVNLVFAKPVFSKIKFWQMIGRGTRTLDPQNLKEWCQEKDSFLIVDHWSNFEYFNLKPEGEVPKPQDSLPTRIFKLRIQKLKCLMVQKQDCLSLIEEIKMSLHALPKDTISIKEKKDVLRRALSDEFWKYIDTDFLIREVAPLLRFTEDVNLHVYAFLLKCERLDLALLTQDVEARKDLEESMREDLRLLPLTLNVVRAKEQEILRASSDAFWTGINREGVDLLKKDIVPLMKYRKEKREEVIEFDLDDRIVERRWIEFGPHGEGEYVHQYREKVEKHIRELADKDETLRKIKNGIPVSDEDIEKLEAKLNGPELYITERVLQDAYEQPAGTFKQFILKLLGKFEFPAREEIVAKAFETFVHGKHYFAADQIRFLRIVKNVFLEKARRRERLTLHDLYEGPFETLGIDAADRLFKKQELEEIIDFLNTQAVLK